MRRSDIREPRSRPKPSGLYQTRNGAIRRCLIRARSRGATRRNLRPARECWRAAARHFNELPISVNTVLTCVPTYWTAVMMKTEMRLAINAYSIAVTPCSSFRNRDKMFKAYTPLVGTVATCLVSVSIYFE